MDLTDRRAVLTLLSVILIGTLHIVKVHGLTCLKCNSMMDPLCRMGFSNVHKCSSDSVGCLTYIGVMPGPLGNMVIRDCTDTPSSGFCSSTLGHEVCVFTCYSNKCNGDTIDDQFMLSIQNTIQ